jgi:hypothetical protein
VLRVKILEKIGRISRLHCVLSHTNCQWGDSKKRSVTLCQRRWGAEDYPDVPPRSQETNGKGPPWSTDKVWGQKREFKNVSALVELFDNRLQRIEMVSNLLGYHSQTSKSHWSSLANSSGGKSRWGNDGVKPSIRTQNFCWKREGESR